MNEPGSLANFYARQQQRHGRSAAVLWLVLGIVVFVADPRARFLSWQAAVFFIAGTFIAALIFGLIGYGLHRAVARWFLRARGSPGTVRAVMLSVLVVEAALIYVAAHGFVRLLF